MTLNCSTWIVWIYLFFLLLCRYQKHSVYTRNIILFIKNSYQIISTKSNFIIYRDPTTLIIYNMYILIILTHFGQELLMTQLLFELFKNNQFSKLILQDENSSMLVFCACVNTSAICDLDRLVLCGMCFWSLHYLFLILHQ